MNFNSKRFSYSKFIFRGAKALIDQLETEKNIEYSYVMDEVAPGIWDCEVMAKDMAGLIKKYAQLRAVGFVEEWGHTCYLHVAYSESGSDVINTSERVGTFNGENEYECRWYCDCPVTADEYEGEEEYSSGGGSEPVFYSFPYDIEWDKPL